MLFDQRKRMDLVLELEEVSSRNSALDGPRIHAS
jgi:hypothetical protein